MKISAIAAVGRNRAIGLQGKLLWNMPTDLARFRAITSGHPIIMGRKTHESIGRVLPKRTNIVVSRDPSYQAGGCVVVHSVDEGIERAKQLDQEEIFVIGGGEIYRAAWPQITRLYLTEINDAPEADAFFPNYSEFKKIVHEESGEEDGLRYVYRIRERT